MRFARQALDETAKEKAKMEMGYNTASTENKELRDQVKEKVKPFIYHSVSDPDPCGSVSM